ETIRTNIEIDPNQPLLFRFINYNGFLCWVERDMFLENYVGGHCLVCPNDPSRLGTWTARYAGDWDFVEQTINMMGGPKLARWLDDVIAIGRPVPDIIEEIRRLAHLET